MKKAIVLAIPLLAFLAFYSISGCKQDQKASGQKVSSHEDTIARGKYLVMSIGCSDCHAPKVPGGMVPDSSRGLSGHPSDQPLPQIDKTQLKSWLLFNQGLTAFVGPWGVSYAANLTPDPSGIGSWTEQQFFTAIRKGKFKGMENNRDLLPPMPWPNYSNLSDDDLKSIFAYLKSQKPVKNVVPSAQPPAGQ